MSKLLVNGIDIEKLCEKATLYKISSTNGQPVDGFNLGNNKGINNVIGTNYGFWRQGTGNNDAGFIYPDPLDKRFMVDGVVQHFVPINGIMRNNIESISGGDDGASIQYVTKYIPSNYSYDLYRVSGSSWTRVASGIKSFNMEFCGSGATGTYAKFTAGAYAASCDGGGGGGGAGTVFLKIVPTHKNTSGLVHATCALGKRAKTENAQFECINKWLYAGAWGHYGYNGSDSIVDIYGVKAVAGYGRASGGSGGGSGGPTGMCVPGINNGEFFTMAENSKLGIPASNFSSNWAYTNNGYTTKQNGYWYLVYYNGELVFKWQVTAYQFGANGGKKCNSGSGVSGTVLLNGTINNDTFSYVGYGGNGFDARDPAAPAGGGASALGSGGGWQEFSGGNIYFGGSSSTQTTDAGYGGGGASGAAAKLFVSVLPTGGNCAWICPGWGGKSLLRVRW